MSYLDNGLYLGLSMSRDTTGNIIHLYQKDGCHSIRIYGATAKY